MVNPAPAEVEVVALASHVFVSPEEIDKTSRGGIILLDDRANQKKLQRGVVLSVGSGTPDIPQQVKYKDVILFPKGEGMDIEIE
jgi:co-chaperonin GroES (HSP10)